MTNQLEENPDQFSMYFCNFERFLKHEWLISKTKSERFISIILCLYGWLICVRFLGAAFVTDPKIWNIIGDPFYITGDRILFNTILFGCSLFGSLYRTAFILGQRSDSFSIIHDMMNLGPESRHHLIEANVRKLTFVAKVCSVVILRMMRYSFSGIFGVIYIYYSLVAYFRGDHYFSATNLLLWFVILQTWAHFITSPIVLPYAILYFTVYYMKQRFKQLNERLNRIRGKAKIYLLIRLFVDHNKLSTMTYKYNEFFKYLIFINHFCVTLIVTLMYYIFFFGEAPLFLRCCNLTVGALDTVMIFLVTRFAASLARESISLYPNIYSYVCKHKLTYKTFWKIQNFIEWISGPTIGIYCLDFFPLTSYGFFEYFLNCLTNFMLMVSLFKNYYAYIKQVLNIHE